MYVSDVGSDIIKNTNQMRCGHYMALRAVN